MQEIKTAKENIYFFQKALALISSDWKGLFPEFRPW